MPMKTVVLWGSHGSTLYVRPFFCRTTDTMVVANMDLVPYRKVSTIRRNDPFRLSPKAVLRVTQLQAGQLPCVASYFGGFERHCGGTTDTIGKIKTARQKSYGICKTSIPIRTYKLLGPGLMSLHGTYQYKLGVWALLPHDQAPKVKLGKVGMHAALEPDFLDNPQGLPVFECWSQGYWDGDGKNICTSELMVERQLVTRQ